MPRPTITEEDLERLEEIVDERTKVPVEHQSVSQRLAFALDELEEADARADRQEERAEALADQVERLEAQNEDLEEQLVEVRNANAGGRPGPGGAPGSPTPNRRNDF